MVKILHTKKKKILGNVEPRYVYGRRVVILHGVAREGITGKVTFDQTPEGGTGYLENSKCQVSGAEACLMDQRDGQGGLSQMVGGEWWKMSSVRLQGPDPLTQGLLVIVI